MNYIRYPVGDQAVLVVDMKQEQTFPFSELALKTIKKMLGEGKRITIIAGRKGFA